MNDTLRREVPQPAQAPGNSHTDSVPSVAAPAAAIQAAARAALKSIDLPTEMGRVPEVARAGPLTWELLVTDGHVRAARLRRLQPWIIALAIVLLVGGAIVIGLAPSIQPATSVSSRVQLKLAQIQRRAEVAFTALGRLTPRIDDPARLPPDREIPDVVKAMLASLTASGDLPEGNLTFKHIDEDAFWAGNWGTQQVSYLKSGGVYLLAAYAHVGPSNSTQPVRWVGAAKKINDKWQYATIAWNGLYMPPGLPGVSPQSIAVSLDAFLPSLPSEETTKK
jgi:hypothetical protein